MLQARELSETLTPGLWVEKRKQTAPIIAPLVSCMQGDVDPSLDDDTRESVTRVSDSDQDSAGLMGQWNVQEWDQPKGVKGIFLGRGKPGITGTLVIDQQIDENTYMGLLKLRVERRGRVLQEMIIEVDESTVTMRGTVVQGRIIWRDEIIELTRSENLMTGRAKERGRPGNSTEVSFLKEE